MFWWDMEMLAGSGTLEVSCREGQMKRFGKASLNPEVSPCEFRFSRNSRKTEKFFPMTHPAAPLGKREKSLRLSVDLSHIDSKRRCQLN